MVVFTACNTALTEHKSDSNPIRATSTPQQIKITDGPDLLNFPSRETNTKPDLSPEKSVTPSPTTVTRTVVIRTPTLMPTPLKPVPDPEEIRDIKFTSQLDTMLQMNCGDWAVDLKQIGGKVLYTRNHLKQIHPASIIKVPTAMLFLRWAETQKVENLSDFLKNKGTNGRTYYQLLKAMVVNTEEEATRILIEFISKKIDSTAALKSWGLTKTSLSPRITTAEEITILFEDLYLGKNLTSFSTQLLLALMEEFTPNDNTRLGVMRAALQPGFHIYNKRGSLTTGPVIVGDAAILVVPIKDSTREYVFVMVGTIPPGAKGCTYEILDETIKRSGNLFVDYLHSNRVVKENEKN